jgi:hypothetical protein
MLAAPAVAFLPLGKLGPPLRQRLQRLLDFRDFGGAHRLEAESRILAIFRWFGHGAPPSLSSMIFFRHALSSRQHWANNAARALFPGRAQNPRKKWI